PSASKTGSRSTSRSPRTASEPRAPAAWIAASPSATPAARSPTSSPTGTTWSIADVGRTPSASSTPRTTSPSSPAASALRRAKPAIDRRLEQMRGEGVKFSTGCYIGRHIPVEDLRKEFHAILLSGGAEQPRDLRVPGRELKGVHYAMEFLPQQNRRCEGDTVP